MSTILYQWHGNLFCIEGMWTRFFPAVEKARSLALGSSDGSEKVVIGVVVQVHSDFNFLPLQGFWNMLKYYDSTATIWDAMMIVFRRTKRPSRQPTSCIKSWYGRKGYLWEAPQSQLSYFYRLAHHTTSQLSNRCYYHTIRNDYQLSLRILMRNS